MDVICNICGEEMRQINEDTWKCFNCNNEAYGPDEKHLIFQEENYVYDEIFGGYVYVEDEYNGITVEIL